MLSCFYILKQIKTPLFKNLFLSLWQTLFWAPKFYVQIGIGVPSFKSI